MTVLVTGAGGTIGGAIVRRLVADGYRVLAHDLRPPEAPAGADGRVTPLAGDLTSAGGRDEIARQAAEHRLDGVVAAHGIDGAASLADLTPDLVRRVLTVNAATVIELHRLTRSALQAAGGAFVAVSSQAGIQGEADNVAYCAAKFAVVGWARAVQAADPRSRVRVLCPGCTASPLLFDAQRRFAQARGVDPGAFLDERRRGIPLQRFAQPDETAAAAVFLLDPAPRPSVLAYTGGEVLA